MCKFNQIFPPKNLEYIWKSLISHICDRLIEFLLTNCKIKLYILFNEWNKDDKKRVNSLCFIDFITL